MSRRAASRMRAELELVGFTVEPTELLAYCQEARRLGVSSNAALRLARSLGLRVRRSRWLELWAAAGAANEAFGGRRAG